MSKPPWRCYLSKLGRCLFISDLQIPFEAENALEFCLAVVKDFRIPLDNIYNVGDEVDQYFGSQYGKSVNGNLTAKGELDITRDKMAAWYKAFPDMKLAISNHGMRWARKAFEAEIPSQMLIPYQKLINAPRSWKWRDKWEIASKHPMTMIHGMGYSGQNGHRNAAIDAGMSVVMGHLHANAGISYIKTEHQRFWGFNTGCLIDEDAIAFEYGKYNRNKPVLGVGVVVDDGLTPIFVPYERF
jgi:UDP-2,3-diacylglucosamine pyrophosphatase LpxH